jgi:endo-1,4-beta-D-glucanase Y
MLARNASLLAFVAALSSAGFVAGCAKPATVTTTSCSSSQLTCGDTCVNAQTDPQNCGSCGKTCGNGSTCTAGSCVCASGYVSCGGSCVASSTDHCGSSCTVCPSGDVCNSDGTCSSSCTSGTKCSDNTCSSSTNPMDCGSCGTACPSGESCVSGNCSCGSSTQMYCGGTCVDITSTANCGSCGNKCGTGQTCSGGNCTGGSGPGTGGSPGTGGTGTGTGGTGTGGTGTGTGGNGTGGSGSGGSSATGGTTGTGGATGTGGSGSQACKTASGDVISDFEDGMGDVVMQGGRQGWWYVFADTNGGSQTPATNATGPIAVAAAGTPLPPGDTCDSYALHSTATGHSATNTSNYEGFGTSLAQILPPPTSTTAMTKNPYDVSAYDGISFNIKSGSGTAPPVWFEIGGVASTPSPDGTATHSGVDEYNTRGHLFSSIGTSWQTIYVPFGTLAPRYLPASSESDCSDTSVKCQAPAWDPKNALGLQFSVYPQFSTSTLNYDLWVDDVTLYHDTTTSSPGLAAFTSTSGTAHPFPINGSVGSCTKPTGADGKFLLDAYVQWKATFVTPCGGNCVLRPENDNDVVSEGIGYGMLIAVFMGDKTLFDGLWSYEQSHKAVGNLMTWCLGSVKSGSGTTCNASGGGSATDADEDMAFALIEAGKQWGGTYASTATSLIGDIWSHDIDTSSDLPTGGSNYSNSTSSKVTNPSYFAPAYYRIFATLDSGHAWGTVATNSYAAIAKVATSSGLLPAWCSNNCSSAGSNGGSDDMDYQYDAHRVPWRLGIDACWNKSSVPSSGMTFLTNNSNFFENIAKAPTAAGGGVGRIQDIYTTSGTVNSDAEPNSMSCVGTAGVGAMAAGNATFAQTAYQFVLDASYTPDPTTRKEAYTYFNATVGLLTALTMSGNFQSF